MRKLDDNPQPPDFDHGTFGELLAHQFEELSDDSMRLNITLDDIKPLGDIVSSTASMLLVIVETSAAEEEAATL